MGRLATNVMVLLIAFALSAQAEKAMLRSFHEAAISPDGTHAAWVQDSDSEGGTSIYLQDLNSSTAKPHRISAGTGENLSEDHIVWSADGKRIAFLSDAEDHNQVQLYVA